MDGIYDKTKRINRRLCNVKIFKFGIRKKNGKLFRTSIVHNKIPETNEDVWVITQYGDRLDSLAHRFYGNPTMWWVIAKANNIFTLKVTEGTSLRIPTITTSDTEGFIV